MLQTQRSKQIFIHLFTVIIFTSLLISPHASSAQTTDELLLTWRANSYAPPSFEGRIFPTRGTSITLGIDVLSSGKFITIANNKINWFINGERFASGIGLQSITYTVPEYSSREQRIKAVVLEYKGINLEKSVTIPIVDTEIAIIGNAPQKSVSPGIVQFRALPYFFNITNLSELFLEWSANGIRSEEESETPHELQLNISDALPGNILNLSVIAQNKTSEIERANTFLRLLIR